MRVFVGRKDSSKAAPDGLLPSVNNSADKLISLFQDKIISPHALVVLLGAHTASEQFFVDTKRAGAPQDGTPGIWDTLFYNQTLGLGPLPKEVLRFPSDIVLSKDPRTTDEWKSFSGLNGQDHWNEDYAFAYVRLSLLGVNNMNDLKECTKVLPISKPNFKGGRSTVEGSMMRERSMNVLMYTSRHSIASKGQQQHRVANNRRFEKVSGNAAFLLSILS